MEQKRVRVLIAGRVQGVSFRYYTMQEAIRQGVTGWVRNLADGRVEAVIEGEADAVDRTVAWCREGPRSARVDQVEILPETPTGEFATFRIR